MDRPDSEVIQMQKSIQHLDVKQCKQLASWLRERIRTLEIDQKLFKISIQQLGLSARTANVLRFHNVYTIGQLLAKSVNPDEIRIMKGAGEKVIRELEQKVAEIRAGKIE